ncbi:MAG: hypothetical protein KC496_22130, partial [Anaerolineae bacterium]|nr:hypothetical protein [Anaerolineae bacterium]
MHFATMRQRPVFFAGGMLVLILLMGVLLPATAQDGDPFATNTPSSPLFATNTAAAPVVASPTTAPMMQDFATNTPSGEPTEIPSPTPLGPAQAAFNYSLRIWVQADLVDLVYQQILALQPEDAAAQRALQMTLYELERRFPDAPRDMAQRQRIIEAMLAAPIGSIDMRGMVRPYIQAAVNEHAGENEFTVDGFSV